MDLEFKYDIGDMVEFTLTSYGSPKVYNGVISERWREKIRYFEHKQVRLYKVNCLQKNMTAFTVSQELIIGKV